jgi:hypothetical protein
MVGSFPWGNFILLGSDFDPLQSSPVENTDGVKTLFIGSSASENDDLVVLFIVVH